MLTSCLSDCRVDRRRADRGTGCSTGPCARGKQICSNKSPPPPPAVMSNCRGHKRLIPGSGESYTTTRVRGRSSLLIRVADPPLPGSVAVARLEAFRCDTLRDHHVIGAHLLRRPSRQYVRECFIQFRAPAHPVAWFATGKSHIVVQSRRVVPSRNAGAGVPGSRHCSKVSIPVIL